MPIFPSSEQQLLEQLSAVLWLLTALGVIINVSKSVLTPSKQRFLGFTINTSSMTITLPPIKKEEIQRGDFMSTLGLLSTDKDPGISIRQQDHAAMFTTTHYHALQNLKITALHAQWEVLLSLEVMNDHRWWSTQLHPHCSSPILKPEASIVITSDVFLHGWGAVCQEVTTGGLWTTETNSHINLLELKVVTLPFSTSWRRISAHVLVRLNNRTAISYSNHMGD